jgi:hypothetical protein
MASYLILIIPKCHRKFFGAKLKKEDHAKLKK